MPRILACFEIDEHGAMDPEAYAALFNAALAERHVDADQVVSITPILDTTTVRVF